MRGSKSRRGDAFLLKVELPRRPDGGRQYKYDTIHGSAKDADRALAKLVHEVSEGIYFEPSTTLFGMYLEEWLEQTGDRLAAKSRERTQSILDLHLKPALGHHPLSKLKPLHIQSYYTQALRAGRGDRKPLSPATVLKHHHVIHRSLRQAVRWQLLARNPAEAVEPPKAVRKEMLALDSGQTAALLAAADGDRLYVPILLATSTGVRRGEMLGLRWADADLDAGTITVRQTIEETATGIAFKAPKTAKGRRTLPIGDCLVAALKRHRDQQERFSAGAGYQNNDLVFALPDGSPWSPAAFSLAFMRLVRSTNLPRVRFHDLRHTHATILLREGVHPKIVSERLGHANIGITLDTYSHVLPGMQEEAARKFDVALTAAIAERAAG